MCRKTKQQKLAFEASCVGLPIRRVMQYRLAVGKDGLFGDLAVMPAQAEIQKLFLLPLRYALKGLGSRLRENDGSVMGGELPRVVGRVALHDAATAAGFCWRS